MYQYHCVCVCVFFLLFCITSAIKRVLTFYILFKIVQWSKDAAQVCTSRRRTDMPSRHQLESQLCLGVIDQESYMPRHQWLGCHLRHWPISNPNDKWSASTLDWSCPTRWIRIIQPNFTDFCSWNRDRVRLCRWMHLLPHPKEGKMWR